MASLDRNAMRERLARWKGEGFIVEKYERMLDESPAALEKDWSRLESAVLGLKDLREELGSIEATGFEQDAAELREKMHDIDRLAEMERELIAFQVKVSRKKREEKRRKEEREKKREEYRQRVAEWRDAGYNTAHLESLLSGDIDQLSKEVVAYRVFIQRLSELDAELRELSPSAGGFERDVASIRSKLKDPERMHEVEEELDGLRASIEEMRDKERQRKEAEKREKALLVERLSSWVTQGYTDGIVDRMDRFAGLDLPTARDEYRKFEEEVRRARRVEEELAGLAVTPCGLEKEIESLKQRCRDVTRIEEWERELAALLSKIEKRKEEERRKRDEEERVRSELKALVAGWQAEGFRVQHISGLLDGDLEAARKELMVFRIRVQKLKEMEVELNGLNLAGLDDDAGAIRALLRNVDAIPEVEERIASLRLAIEKRQDAERRRQDYRLRMEEWRRQGYSTARLERCFDRDIEFLAKEFLVFKIRVQKLKEMEDELKAMDSIGFERDVAAVRSKLYDVERLSEVREALTDLQGKIEKRREEERSRRGEMKRMKEGAMGKVTALIAEGFVLEGIDDLFDQDPDRIDDAVAGLESKVEACRSLRRELAAMDARGFEAEVESIQAKLAHLDRAEEAGREILALKNRVEVRRAEVERRRTENERKRQEYLERIARWKAAGYRVAALEGAAAGDVPTLRREISLFSIRMQKLHELEKEVEALASAGLTRETAELRALTRDADNIPAIEQRLAEFEAKVREKRDSEKKQKEEAKRKRGELVEKMLEWASQGVIVDGLESVMDKDTATASAAFSDFEAAMYRMRELNKMLYSVDLTGFESEADEIEAQMSDPSRVRAVEAAVIALLQKVKGAPPVLPETPPVTPRVPAQPPVTPQPPATPAGTGAVERRNSGSSEAQGDQLKRDLTKLVKVWKDMGFNVSRLEKVLDRDGATIKSEVDRFKTDIQRLKAVRDRLHGVRGAPPDRVKAIQAKLLDVDRLQEIEREVEELERGGTGRGAVDAAEQRMVKKVKRT